MLPVSWLFWLGLGAILTAEEAGIFLLPGDISMVAAGVYGGRGGPSIVVSWLIASAGMSVGSCVLFFTVRRHRSSSRILPARVHALIHRYGQWGVVLARLVPGLRNATVVATAAAALPPSRFLAGLIPAALIWSGLLLVLGWFGGDTFLAVLASLDAHPALKIASFAFVLAGSAAWAVRLRATSRQSATS